MQDHPQARTEGIVSERIDEDLVLYDQLGHTAHSLSAAAAMVWELCDGQRSRHDLADQTALAPAIVAQALDELRSCGLLDDPAVEVPGFSRRDAAKKLAKVGAVAFSAPLIYSVAIGPAMAAASGTGNGAADGTSIPTASCNASPTGFGTATAGTCASGTCYKNRTGDAAYCQTSGSCAPYGSFGSGTACTPEATQYAKVCCDPGTGCTGGGTADAGGTPGALCGS